MRKTTFERAWAYFEIFSLVLWIVFSIVLFFIDVADAKTGMSRYFLATLTIVTYLCVSLVLIDRGLRIFMDDD